MSAVDVSPSYAHLAALSDAHGVFEHALLDIPRREHGYCVDDVARALIVLVREPDQTPELAALTEVCLRFVEDAVAAGRSRCTIAWPPTARGATSPRSATGGAGRCGRSASPPLAPARSTSAAARARPHSTAPRPRGLRSVGPWCSRLSALPRCWRRFRTDLSARALMLDGVTAIALPSDAAWEWPESRLRYANAAVPEALLAAGVVMDDPRMLRHGLSMLRFLVDLETRDGHLSVTGSAGGVRAQRSAQFDQQPIEVAALADACARAFDITAEPEWRDIVASAWAWFGPCLMSPTWYLKVFNFTVTVSKE